MDSEHRYIFVKPDMALEGKTPANAAGLNVKGWVELLKTAARYTSTD